MVKLLNSKEHHNELHYLLHDIRELMDKFPCISVIYISPTSNVLADSIAKQVLNSQSSFVTNPTIIFWMEWKLLTKKKKKDEIN